MKHIGLISDTHGYLDEKVFSYFAECDEIWHAGDIGTEEIALRLAAFKPFKAVYGNIDGGVLRHDFPEESIFQCEDVLVFMVHIGGKPGYYPAKIKSKLKVLKPQLYICGHSHILRIVTDTSMHQMLHMNPGAAGVHGFHQVRTLVRLKIDGARIFDVQVIELGNRGGK